MFSSKMEEKSRTDILYGSVCIVKTPSGNQFDYVPNFFHDNEPIPRVFGASNHIVVYRKVNALENVVAIQELCRKTSTRKITESDLKRELNSLLGEK